MLLGDHCGNIILVLLEQFLVLEHVSYSLRDWHILPSLKSLCTIGNCFIELILSGHWYLGNHILGKWALYIESLSGFTVHPFSIDEVLVDFAESASLWLHKHCVELSLLNLIYIYLIEIEFAL